MSLLALLLLFLSMTGHSAATYCLCKDGGKDDAYQKALDYACGAGADCTPIQQNGACYNPSSVKSHCDYAVNSYYQKKGGAAGACDFSGVAAPSANPPTTIVTGCSYPNGGGTSTGTSGTGTTGTGTTGTTGTTTSGLTPGTTTGVTNPFDGGLGPSSVIDPSGGVSLLRVKGSFIFWLLMINLVLMWARGE